MKRRIVLVELYWGRDKDPRVPLGHASLLAALEGAPVDVRSIALPVNEAPAPQAIADAILGHAAGCEPSQVDVGFGVYIWNEQDVQTVMTLLRERGFRGRIILGGPQISYVHGGLEALYPTADVFIRGYGESALAELVHNPGTPRIAGVHYAGQEDLGEQAVVDFDGLRSPWLSWTIPLESQKFVRWETQRGCPFKCTFCQHRSADARFRRRPVDHQRVLREIDMFCDAGVEDIAVLDPIFNVSPTCIQVLERFHERGFTGRLSLQCRGESLRPAFLDAAAKLNVRLELGLQTIHDREQKIIKRNNYLDKVDRALALMRERKINHEVSLIFGLPEQTLTSFLESVDWCLQRRVPVIKAFPLMLLRGTEVERDRARWSLVEDGSAMPVVISSSTFSRADWNAMNAVSTSLQQTEGNHPGSVSALMERGTSSAPDPSRWRPVRETSVELQHSGTAASAARI